MVGACGWWGALTNANGQLAGFVTISSFTIVMDLGLHRRTATGLVLESTSSSFRRVTRRRGTIRSSSKPNMMRDVVGSSRRKIIPASCSCCAWIALPNSWIPPFSSFVQSARLERVDWLQPQQYLARRMRSHQSSGRLTKTKFGWHGGRTNRIPSAKKTFSSTSGIGGKIRTLTRPVLTWVFASAGRKVNVRTCGRPMVNICRSRAAIHIGAMLRSAGQTAAGVSLTSSHAAQIPSKRAP